MVGSCRVGTLPENQARRHHLNHRYHEGPSCPTMETGGHDRHGFSMAEIKVGDRGNSSRTKARCRRARNALAFPQEKDAEARPGAARRSRGLEKNTRPDQGGLAADPA